MVVFTRRGWCCLTEPFFSPAKLPLVCSCLPAPMCTSKHKLDSRLFFLTKKKRRPPLRSGEKNAYKGKTTKQVFSSELGTWRTPLESSDQTGVLLKNLKQPNVASIINHTKRRKWWELAVANHTQDCQEDHFLCGVAYASRDRLATPPPKKKERLNLVVFAISLRAFFFARNFRHILVVNSKLGGCCVCALWANFLWELITFACLGTFLFVI